jgi:ABC-type antimicrobial peptide transport system permease subunit
VLRSQGFHPAQVWGVLLLQNAVVLAVGAALGAVFGLGGQVLASRWVSLTTGFPSIFSPAFGLAAWTFAGVALVALAAVSAPGYAAARVPPAMSFQGD